MPKAELTCRKRNFRLEEDSSSDDEDRFKSILPYKLEGWDKARLCNDRSTSFINLKYPATPKKRGREEDVNKTPEEQTDGQPGFPMYKGNIKSKKKRGNKGGEVIYRKGDVKYSEAMAHCKTIWNKAFPCAICKDLRNAECFEIKECLGWDLFLDSPKLRDQIN
ncbi:uncharacterized protein MYCGRDRAFT_90047 [Zymoseptoria tritici IPO323]|uniref:Uncharacterized protein n=1 Tax=Zymoseptoria tritici (strain CBS 115943 / IPO323) TaxID=336722 RepID=F9WX07_ZYMTI|nr:uncharacterized protein MYCGRDRAFT_90047 [Zymoseptoria tritici IPO323]EGP91663.1 hypothetical protein MYCGRDRAFT_90047 [Zymoseptoria tritici IPO323]